MAIINNYQTGDPIAVIDWSEDLETAYREDADPVSGAITIDELARFVYGGLPAELDDLPCDMLVFVVE